MKSKNVCNKTRSAPASLQFKGQGTEHTTVKLPIKATCCILKCSVCEFISLRDCDRVWLFRWEYFNPLSVNRYTPKTVQTIKIYTYNYYEKENKNIEMKSLYKYMTYKYKSMKQEYTNKLVIAIVKYQRAKILPTSSPWLFPQKMGGAGKGTHFLREKPWGQGWNFTYTRAPLNLFRNVMKYSNWWKIDRT